LLGVPKLFSFKMRTLREFGISGILEEEPGDIINSALTPPLPLFMSNESLGAMALKTTFD
jgi:hypothetical protein